MVPGQSGCGRPGGQMCPEMLVQVSSGHIPIWPILEGNWTNCKEIFYEARKRDTKLGMATVYRTVSTLEEIGVLTRSYQYSFVSDKEEDIRSRENN